MSGHGIVPHRELITVSVLLVVFIQALDSLIAIVAMPCSQRRRGFLGADFLRHRQRNHDGAGRMDGGKVRP